MSPSAVLQVAILACMHPLPPLPRQVLEVGATAEAATATAARPRAADSLTVAELKDRCKKRGLSSFGSRRELVTRLQKAGVL